MTDDVKFESTPAAPSQTFDHGTYDQGLFALRFDAGVAENVFARRAKADLAKRLKKPWRLETQIPNDVQVWVAQLTTVLVITDLPTEKPVRETDAARKLKHLVKRLALDIESTRSGSSTLVLYEGLSVRVQQVGPKQYSFSVKQKWGLE